MIEDAVVIYRITRAPERRVFYVDVGNLPKQKAEEYVRGLMNRYRNKLMYDPNTGEVADSRKHLSMLEDFWMPRREGGRGTEIQTLEAGQNLSEMEDVKYFQKKLFQSLNVPASRLEEQSGFNLGRASEISRDEVKFFKFVERLRMKFSELFLELKESEILKDRLQTARDAEDFIGKYYSREWVRKKILRQTEDDVEQIDKQINAEQAAGLLQPPMGPEAGGMGAPGQPPMGEPAPAMPTLSPAPQREGPQVTIGEIVPDDEEGWNT
jgi:hypothetical protein